MPTSNTQLDEPGKVINPEQPEEADGKEHLDRQFPGFSYSVKFVCGVQPENECGCGCAPVRPGAYATEINIHNYNNVRAEINKSVIPVVLAGNPIGREPRTVGSMGAEQISLPASHATMDDCCKIYELLSGHIPPSSPPPLTIGFLHIRSNRPLNVTAVYTATDLKSQSISIDVERVQANNQF